MEEVLYYEVHYQEITIGIGMLYFVLTRSLKKNHMHKMHNTSSSSCQSMSNESQRQNNNSTNNNDNNNNNINNN